MFQIFKLQQTMEFKASIGGRLGVPFIHLFIYICWSYRMGALMLYYNFMAPSTCKDAISASAISHL